jgi:hypothetical protein
LWIKLKFLFLGVGSKLRTSSMSMFSLQEASLRLKYDEKLPGDVIIDSVKNLFCGKLLKLLIIGDGHPGLKLFIDIRLCICGGTGEFMDGL